MTDEEILSVIDAIHDRWFSVDDIEYDEVTRIWSVPFSAHPTMRPPRVRSLKGVTGAQVLEVRGVDSVELTDTEQVVWYDFNVIRYRAAEGIIDIATGVPLGLRLHVSSPEVCVRDQP